MKTIILLSTVSAAALALLSTSASAQYRRAPGPEEYTPYAAPYLWYQPVPRAPGSPGTFGNDARTGSFTDQTATGGPSGGSMSSGY